MSTIECSPGASSAQWLFARSHCHCACTVCSGTILCEANLVHGGKSTQVWDATVTDAANGKVITLFRCTQIILYDKAKQ